MASEVRSGQEELFEALTAHETRFTPSERAIAAWMRGNIETLPFNTGGQIAASIGVSEMTLIRFLRGLGYSSLRDLKEQLRPGPSPMAAILDDVAVRFTDRSTDVGTLASSLKRELMAVRRAYEMATTPGWERIVARLVETPLIHVVGFQASQGIAMDFASRLKYVRAGVRFAHGSAGVFVEVLECDPAKTLIFIVDTAAYARKGVLLARKAVELGIPLVIMTDRYSHWARAFTDDVLEMNTYVNTVWDSAASLAVACNLLIHFTAERLGPISKARFDQMFLLGEHFQEFDMAATRPGQAWRDRQRSGGGT